MNYSVERFFISEIKFAEQHKKKPKFILIKSNARARQDSSGETRI